MTAALPAGAAGPAQRRVRPLGVFAVITAVACFSISSSLVRKSAAPGPTIAFWRMVGSSLVWTIVLFVVERRWVTAKEFRRAIVPGIAFGLNITLFFSAITSTTVANAEFITTLSPVVLVPAGAIIFKEHIDPKALMFGLISVVGLSFVLFFAPTGQSGAQASWLGNGMAFCSMGVWSVYVLSSRRMRASTSVVAIMASIMPIAALTVLPITAVKGEIDDVTVRAALYIAVLTLLTGTVAHGLIVFAQRTVPVGTMSMLQVAQPALAVLWSVLLLSARVRAVQVAGMALVIAGLMLMMLQTRRSRRAQELLPTHLGPAAE